MTTTLKSNIQKLAIALLISVFMIPSLALAFDPGMGRSGQGFAKHKGQRSPFGFWKNPKVISQLGLTSDQVNQIKNADFGYRENCLELKNQLATLNLKMEKAFSDEIANESDILKTAKNVSDLKGKLYIKHIEAQLNLKKLLTPEQYQKLLAGRKNMPAGQKMRKHQRRHFNEAADL